MKNEDLLISKLIEETCIEKPEDSEKFNQSEAEPISNLAKYFERRRNQVEYNSLDTYIQEEALDAFKIALEEQTKCYRLICGESVLDFPSNWSVFEQIGTKPFVIVSSHNDNDFLCEIFSEINTHCESFILTNESGKFQIIFFNDYSWKTHGEWIREYFMNKEESKKAA